MTPSLDPAGKGQLIADVITAVDPRNGDEVRDAAFIRATSEDSLMAALTAIGLLHGVLSSLQKQFGMETVDSAIQGMYRVGMGVVGSDDDAG